MRKKLMLTVMLVALSLATSGCFTMTISGNVKIGTAAAPGAIVVCVGASIDALDQVVTVMNSLSGSPTAAEVQAAIDTALTVSSVEAMAADANGDYEFTGQPMGPYIILAIAPPDHMTPANKIIEPPSMLNLTSAGNDLVLE